MKEDKNSPTGRCEGEIDYDAGYNNLYCKKCGRIYRAYELAKKLDTKELITRPENGGKYKMKVTISGGSKCRDYNVTTTIDTQNVNEVKEHVVWTSNEKTQSRELHVSLKDALNKNKPQVTREVKTSNNKPVSEVKKAESIVENSVNGVHNEVVPEEPKAEDVKVEEPKVEVNVEVVKEEVKPVLTSPIKIKTEEEKKSPSEILKNSMYEAAKNISGAELSGNADTDYISGLLKDIKFIIDTARDLKAWNKENEKELLGIVLDNTNLELESEIKVEGNLATATGSINYIKDTNQIVIAKVVSTEIGTVKEDVEVAEAEKEEPVKAAEEMEVSDDDYVEYEESTEYEDDGFYLDESSEKLNGIATFTGKIINVAEKISNMDAKNVLVIEDATGELLTVGNNELLVIDRIDGMDTSEIKIVSKTFLDNVMKEIDSRAVEPDAEGNLPTVNGVPNEG